MSALLPKVTACQSEAIAKQGLSSSDGLDAMQDENDHLARSLKLGFQEFAERHQIPESERGRRMVAFVAGAGYAYLALHRQAESDMMQIALDEAEQPGDVF